jgi:hypothetical protein
MLAKRGKEIKVRKGIMKRKKEIIYRIIFDGSCAVCGIVRGKITKYTRGKNKVWWLCPNGCCLLSS